MPNPHLPHLRNELCINEAAEERIMVEVNRRAYEEVIGKIMRSKDREELMDQFSGDLVFYSSVLRDIARGKGSANYHVLNEWTKNKWLVEKFIIEEARSVLSNFGIRESGGEEGEVVGEYRGERFVTVPVVVRKEVGGSKKYVYLLSLLVLVIGVIFYVVRFYGLGGEEADGTGVKEVKEEGLTDRTSELPSKTSPAKPRKEKKGSPSHPLKQKGDAPVNQETGQKGKELKWSKYIVEGGDNLWDIARKFNTTVKSLKDANGLASNRLDIGDVLVIPENNGK